MRREVRMVAEASLLACPACGARQAVRQDAVLVCEYCGTRSTPRLLPGTLCGERAGSGSCMEIAQTLCRGCGRPLCDRHNDPKVVYWHELMHWRRLVPGWSETDGADWERLLVAPFPFPVPGFEAFPWVPSLRPALYELGCLEAEMLEALRPVVAVAEGDPSDDQVRFSSVCCACEQGVEKRLQDCLAAFTDRYRALAYRARLRALGEEARQGLRVVDAWLRRPLAPRSSRELTQLDGESPPADWDRWGHELRERLARLDALEARLQRGA